MAFCILIPTINQKELLEQALSYYAKNFPRTKKYILDNGNQDIERYDENTTIYVSESNMGVAASWNYLIKKAIEDGHDKFLILNDDIILTLDEETIIRIISRWVDNFIVCRPFYNWSAFILNKKIYDKVGEFDENFKICYFEDNDYKYRMELQGILIKYEDLLSPEVYNNSMTIKKDPTLNNFDNNRKYYIEKWGELPNNEKYKTPFNK
jgi:GT2 family glycosyltransferase